MAIASASPFSAPPPLKQGRVLDTSITEIGDIDTNVVVRPTGQTPPIATPAPTPAPTAAASKPKPTSSQDSEPQSALVDYEADDMYDRGDGITRLVDNARFHHNGAIIECDSALLYDKNRMDFFGNVIICQDSTYIYGDRVNYDGRTAVADVFAPIVKTMRGDMTLYSYNLSFNTKTKIGTYYAGGVLRSADKLMESYKGEYNAETGVVKFMDSVAMSSDSYIIRTDSISYDLDAETATFLDRTYIWDNERDFLLSDRGNYFANSKTYLFTHDAYIMTPDNEMWADTVRYVTPVKQAFMQRNVQILDTANQTLAFGDWGFYDDSLGNAVLTEMPSVRSWQEPGDTSYMRADTIRMLSFAPGMSKLAASDSMGMESADELEQNSMDYTDSLGIAASTRDSLPQMAAVDSMSQITINDSIPKRADTILIRDTIPIADTTIFAIDSVSIRDTPAIAEPIPIGDSLGPNDTIIFNDSLSFSDSLMVRDSITVSDSTKIEKPEKERVMRAYHNVRLWSADYQGVCDSTVSFSVDSTAIMYGKPILWSDNNQITSQQIDVYTKNEQMDWADFTGEPFITQQVLPNDTLQFNQASGKQMKVYFKDNEIDYTWLTGNVLNLYYMDEDKEIVAMAVISCADLTMLFENRTPVRMIWGGQGEGPIYPIEKIPEDQTRFLEGFTWQQEIRPKNAKEICNRISKPSYRSIAEKFYKPSFSINVGMENSKTQFKANNSWRDRVDITSATPEYFEQRNRDLLF